jgi:hypothetical protein
MMSFLHDLSPAVAALAACGAIWALRNRTHGRAATRARQLQESAALLDAHANRMARFLAADAPDAELKCLAISFSDAMDQRKVVARLAAWASSHQVGKDGNSAHRTMLNALRAISPDLADEFRTAIMTAAMGACLRWPESAVHFERIFATLATIPRSEITIAAAAGRLREPVPFSMRPGVPAMA